MHKIQSDTVFLMTDQSYSYLSSSIVRQLAKLDGNISDYVSEYVKTKLEEKVSMDKIKGIIFLLESLIKSSKKKTNVIKINYWLTL